jgi:hypothetical protein
MLLRRLSLLAAGVGLAASLALARPAEAATTITVTATGTISEGTDFDGADATGLFASLVHVFTVSPGAIIDDSEPGKLFAFFERVATTVTVGATSLSFTSTVGNGTYNVLSGIGLDAGSEIFDGVSQLVSSLVVFDEELVLVTPFDEFRYTADPGGWSFGASAFGENFVLLWSFLATPDSVVVAVPAPASLGLFLAGLAGLAAARRLRRAGVPTPV